MADSDQTNVDTPHLPEEVIAAVPLPNRATRRKMAALGDAVPVTPSVLSTESESSEFHAPEADLADAPVTSTILKDAGSAGDSVLEAASAPPAKAPRRAAARKLPTPDTTVASEPSSAIVPDNAPAPLAQPEVEPIAVPPSEPAMQAIAPASLIREPAGSAPAQPAATAKPTFPVFSIKDMTMDMSTNFSGFQTAMTDAQAKAQAAFEKSSTAMGEMGAFAKGNVEAMVESGKILAEGVQEIGSTLVAESRTAFESMTGDIKELAAAKSPTDFLKIQSDMLRKSFDSFVAHGSKNSETFLKLMSDAAAPLSGRVSLAVEKVRQTATASTSAAA